MTGKMTTMVYPSPCQIVRHIILYIIVMIVTLLQQTYVTEAGKQQDLIRLVGGDNSYSGRIELYLNNTWSTVCNVGWDMSDAKVACKMAGFKRAEATYGNALFGKGSGNILLSDVKCSGEEKSLFECGHSGFYVHKCSHDEDVGVVCGPAPEDRNVDPHLGRKVVISLAIIVLVIISLFLNQHRRLSNRHRRHISCRETIEFTGIALSSCCSCKSTEEPPQSSTTVTAANGRAVSTTTNDNDRCTRWRFCKRSNCRKPCQSQSKTDKEPKAKFSYWKFRDEDDDDEPRQQTPKGPNSTPAPSSNSNGASVQSDPKTGQSLYTTSASENTKSNSPSEANDISKTNVPDGDSEKETTVDNSVKTTATLDNESNATVTTDTTLDKVDEPKTAATTVDNGKAEVSVPSINVVVDNTVDSGFSNSAFQSDDIV